MAKTWTVPGISYLTNLLEIPVEKVVAGKRIIPLEEVSWHDSVSDCWIIIYDRVYDITNFIDEVRILFN